MEEVIIFKGDFTDVRDFLYLKDSLKGCYKIKHENESNECLIINCQLVES